MTGSAPIGSPADTAPADGLLVFPADPASKGCTTEKNKINSAALRSHRARESFRLWRDNNANLHVDGANNSMSGQLEWFSRLRRMPLRVELPTPGSAGKQVR